MQLPLCILHDETYFKQALRFQRYFEKGTNEVFCGIDSSADGRWQIAVSWLSEQVQGLVQMNGPIKMIYIGKAVGIVRWILK